MSNQQSAISQLPAAINAHTRLVGIIGWPVAHSLSPGMHNAAFRELGLNYAYVPLPVPPDRLEAAVEGLVALGFMGANVTVPHKSAILPYLDELTPVARAIGASNTLVVRPDGTMLGDNTDAYGFAADLTAHGISVCRRALVIGAGGAARAVVYALAQAGTTVAVASRTLSRAVELCQTIGQALALDPAASKSLSGHRFPDDLPGLARDADLIVNATTLGLHSAEDPLPWDPAISFRPDQVVYDLIYAPGGARAEAHGTFVQTPFLALAARDGARAIDGSGMLVHQGARAFELWTGLAAPVAVMADALIESPGDKTQDVKRET